MRKVGSPRARQPVLLTRLAEIRPAVQVGRLDSELGQDRHNLRAVFGGMVDGLGQQDRLGHLARRAFPIDPDRVAGLNFGRPLDQARARGAQRLAHFGDRQGRGILRTAVGRAGADARKIRAFGGGDVLQGVVDRAIGSGKAGVQLFGAQPGACFEQAQVGPLVVTEKSGQGVGRVHKISFFSLGTISEHYTSGRQELYKHTSPGKKARHLCQRRGLFIYFFAHFLRPLLIDGRFMIARFHLTRRHLSLL